MCVRKISLEWKSLHDTARITRLKATSMSVQGKCKKKKKTEYPITEKPYNVTLAIRVNKTLT